MISARAGGPCGEAAPAAPAAARRLVLVRHGRTAWNAEGRYQGHADVPLDGEGVAQADGLAGPLAALGPALVVCSDLQRAVATAAPIARRAGLAPVLDRRLREVDVGAWEGLTAEAAEARFGDEYEAWRAGIDVVRGGGETRAAAGRRAADALVEHAASVAPGQLVVAVSHGMVVRAALRALRAAGRVELDGDPPHLANAEWMDLQLVP